MPDRATGPILLFDGDCALCVRSVQFVLRHESPERPHLLRFAPLQGATGLAIQQAHPALSHIDSVVWFEHETPRIRSEAVLAVLRYLGGPWALLASIGRVIPLVIRDRAYGLVARSRRRVFGTGCLVPTAEERDRILP
jgi:predicted DCC family thiol-disulfide oxidoreductase YuxK